LPHLEVEKVPPPQKYMACLSSGLKTLAVADIAGDGEPDTQASIISLSSELLDR
jgi:hypothetical protein